MLLTTHFFISLFSFNLFGKFDSIESIRFISLYFLLAKLK
nr:MAG TPA: hypothetical protein [Caudoviricetes sp.]